ncbi:type 4a pilus biogenesis protein PilO [Arenimonas sp.]|jgi:type IV pilus assembly protein PilO|uniref:type 4a pilus biogenesis protein PilO n=1 Tax=Arenimonas sp. TaxID=1872635 RepID=UPI0037C1A766
MKNINLSDIDFKASGYWPKELKYGVCFSLGFLVLLVAWFFIIKDKRDEMLRLESDETALRADFENKQARASNLEPIKQQLVQMELILQQMLRQLPSKNEMPDLIVDVSQQALESGISNELFQPGPETLREFYAEKPISIRMVGNYHQFGTFMSGVASLPRVVIMTMHDISLKPRGTNKELLEMAGTIKTYRYLDPDEQAAAPLEEDGP